MMARLSTKLASLLRNGCLALVLVFTFSPSIVRADAGLDDYNLAASLYKQSRWREAGEALKDFLDRYPRHEKVPPAQFYYGLTLINQQDYRGARDVLRAFVKSFPDNQNIAYGRYRVAECSYLLNDYPAARAELEDFLKQHDKDPLAERALLYLGEVLLQTRDAAGALNAYRTAATRFPEGPLRFETQFGVARALEATGDRGGARQRYEQILADEKHPRAVDAQFHLAAMAFDAGEFANAAAGYLEVDRKFPKHPLSATARLNAGYSLYQGRQFADAARQFDRVLKENPTSVNAAYWQALSWKQLGEFDRAVPLFAEAYQLAKNDPLAETILYQQALSERLRGRPAEVRRLTAELSQRWPQGKLADESLHLAAEVSLEEGNLEQAAEFIGRFDREFRDSPLAQAQELLKARLLIAQATAAVAVNKADDAKAAFAQAATLLDGLMRDGKTPRLQAQSRYYLALTRQLENRHAEAVELIAPLASQAAATTTAPEVAESLLLLAESRLALNEAEDAGTQASRYLELYPQGRQRPRALTVQGLAAARQQNWERVDEIRKQFVRDFPGDPALSGMTLAVAEYAESQAAWPQAAKYFAALVSLSEGNKNQAFALRGLAWAQYRQQQFADAAATFQRLLDAFPDHRLTSEAAYYRAESLLASGKEDEALAAFEACLKEYSPAQPLPPKGEQQSPYIYAYRSGLQAARIYRKRQAVDEAEALYTRLLEKFPQPDRIDRLLDEWALLNYEAQRFERSDELFRRLVAEAPESDLADNARLSLAESDLIAGKFDAARETFAALADASQSDVAVQERALYQLLVLSGEQRKWDDLDRWATKLLEKFPAGPHRHFARLSQAEARLARPAASDDELRQVLELLAPIMAELRQTREHPEQATPALVAESRQAWAGRVWVLSAETQFRLKNYDAVPQLVDELRAWSPPSPFLYQGEEVVGRSYKQQAKFDEARQAFGRVVADERAAGTETAAKCQFLLAETYFLQENWKQAFREYQKVYALHTHPDWQSAALLQSGKCDEQQAQWTQAAQTYERLIAEFPASGAVKEARERLASVRQRAAGNAG